VPKRGEQRRAWQKLHNEYLHDLYYSADVDFGVKSKLNVKEKVHRRMKMH
jgi:hypothetical protein